MWFRGVILEKANSPHRITARRGGGVIKKMARSLLIDPAGVVFLVRSIGTPPCPRKKRMLRSIFLIARPPLLCRDSVKAESHGLRFSKAKITAASKRIDTNVSSVAILLPRRSPYCSPNPPLLIGSEGRIRDAANFESC